jgi:hypothetical protein
MTTTIEAMETVIRLERALASGNRQLTPEKIAAAQEELAAARAEIKPLSEAMDWAFQQVATFRADRRRLEGALNKARRALAKAQEEGAAAAAAAAKKYVGVRAAVEAKKTPPAVIAAQKEIVDAEQALADLDKESRFVARLVEEECQFLDGMDSLREWTARGRVGDPPSCAVAWAESARANAEALYPLTALPAWTPVNEDRVYADVADSADEDTLLWSLPEPVVEVAPPVNVTPVVAKPKKSVIPADETPAQRKRRMLFRKIGVAAA